MTIAVISMIRDAWGGSEELWYDMAKEALLQGHRVLHLAYETPTTHQKIHELEAMGMERITRPGWMPPDAGKKKLLYLGYNFLRKKISDPVNKILSLKPDVVLYNGTCYSIKNERSLLKQLLQNAKASVRFFIIGHLNNDFSRDLSEGEASLVKAAYRRCQKVFFISERSIQTAQRQLCDEISNASVIRNPVNLSSTELIEFPPIDNIIKFALVGILVTPHKGQDILFHALSQWEEKGWQLNVYGSGSDLVYLQQLSAHLQLSEKIIFHGKVDDIRKVWETNHALIMPSIMEGMPLAVVEAMLCGRLCIATNIGGHAEWITDGENGFIAEAPTVTSLLKVLEKAFTRKNEWKEMSQKAHDRAHELYGAHAGATLLNHLTEQ